MKVGDWVFFKTRNWPKNVQITRVDSATGKKKGRYRPRALPGPGQDHWGRGRQHHRAEEKSNRIVEVGPHPEDVIRSLGFEYSTLTLGVLRAFLEQHRMPQTTFP